MADILPYQGDAYAELTNLKDPTAAANVYVNDATVTVTLFKKNGQPVTNAIDLPATYVASSNGRYRAIIPRIASVVLNGTYDCRAKAVKGGLEMSFWQEVVVQKLSA